MEKYSRNMVSTLSRADLELIVHDLVACMNQDRLRDHVFPVGSPEHQQMIIGQGESAVRPPEWASLDVLIQRQDPTVEVA